MGGTTMKKIGTRIKEKRLLAGMTQEELAFKVGYRNKSTITKIENGTNDISQGRVADFAAALNTSVSYLMGWDNSPNADSQQNNTPNVHTWVNNSNFDITKTASRSAIISIEKSEGDLHLLVDIYRNLPDETKKRLLSYATKLNELYQEESLINSAFSRILVDPITDSPIKTNNDVNSLDDNS